MQMIDRGMARGVCAIVLSMISMNFGAAFAKTLFPSVGALGMSGLRVGLAALVLSIGLRPWQRHVPREKWLPLLGYGLALGLMNICTYQAYARIPIGLGLAIGMMGPISIAALGSRRTPVTIFWLGTTLAGLLLLAPGLGTSLDPLGVTFATLGALCWAAYIVMGSRLAHVGVGIIAWAMIIAAIVAAPLGLLDARSSLWLPQTWMSALIVAVFSSALPYSLELLSLRYVPAPMFGALFCFAPAVGALTGYLVLGERVSTIQWLAVSIIILSAINVTWASTSFSSSADADQ